MKRMSALNKGAQLVILTGFKPCTQLQDPVPTQTLLSPKKNT